MDKVISSIFASALFFAAVISYLMGHPVPAACFAGSLILLIIAHQA